VAEGEPASGAGLKFEARRNGHAETRPDGFALTRMEGDVLDRSDVHSGGPRGGIFGGQGIVGGGDRDGNTMGRHRLENTGRVRLQVERWGEELWIVRWEGEVLPWVLAEEIRSQRWAGVREVFPALASVGIEADPNFSWPDDFTPRLTVSPARVGQEHLIPTCFDPRLGPDLEPSAQTLGLTLSELIEEFCGATYTVACLGFSPGFPYLAGLPGRLSGLGRLSSPRLQVPAGTVAITGQQTGIYRGQTPGGWNLLGQTRYGTTDAEPERTFQSGDIVRFEPISWSVWQDQK